MATPVHNFFVKTRDFLMTAEIIDFAIMTKKLLNPPNRLREQRKKKGYTLAQLSAHTGLDTGYLSKLELGDRPLKIEHMRSIAKVFGVDPGDLMNATDNPTSLTDQERMVLDSMRDDPMFAAGIAAMAEARHSYRPAPQITPFPKSS